MLKDVYRFFSPKFQNLFLEYKVSFEPRYGHGKPPHQELYQIINARRATYQELLESFLAHEQVFVNIRDAKAETNANQPAWNNGFLPGLDMVGIYGMLARFRPRQYVEVGSGNSTCTDEADCFSSAARSRIARIDRSCSITS